MLVFIVAVIAGIVVLTLVLGAFRRGDLTSVGLSASVTRLVKLDVNLQGRSKDKPDVDHDAAA